MAIMINSRVREYNSLLQRLKYLVDRNRADSDDAEGIRELLSDCYRSFSEEDCAIADEKVDSMQLEEYL